LPELLLAFSSHGREFGVAVCALNENSDLITPCVVPEDLVPGVLRADSGGEDSFVLANLALVATGFFPLREDMTERAEGDSSLTPCVEIFLREGKTERAEEIDLLEGDSSLTPCMDFLLRKDVTERAEEIDLLEGDSSLTSCVEIFLREGKAERAEEIDRLEGDSSLICSV